MMGWRTNNSNRSARPNNTDQDLTSFKGRATICIHRRAVPQGVRADDPFADTCWDNGNFPRKHIKISVIKFE